MNELNTDGVFWIALLFVVSSVALAIYLKLYLSSKK